ncbi:helix-turn-helix domain-containing protein [Crenobacter caeni]|uniref:Helix-turn-helix domain-containing protein n=1 Tax=Crenobacter caeni TaxID=2705474 RepID=A0A6B2KVC3_9NEIS|nr:helix-turn-helix domain-containing protein [Crenobacter caeni]
MENVLPPPHEGERYQIQLLASEGYGPTAIDQRVGRCKSVISRELRRNRSVSGRYRASEAQRTYRKHLRTKGRSRQPLHRLFVSAPPPPSLHPQAD